MIDNKIRCFQCKVKETSDTDIFPTFIIDTKASRPLICELCGNSTFIRWTITQTTKISEHNLKNQEI